MSVSNVYIKSNVPASNQMLASNVAFNAMHVLNPGILSINVHGMILTCFKRAAEMHVALPTSNKHVLNKLLPMNDGTRIQNTGYKSYPILICYPILTCYPILIYQHG